MAMNLSDAIAETEEALQLFLENNFEEAERKMAKFAHCSIYHALGHGTILFIRAMMSCERADMDRAMIAVGNGCSLINQFRPRNSLAQEFLCRIRGNFGQITMTDEEMHAELCYAELLLARALLSLFADDSLTSLIKGAFRIRSCYFSFKNLYGLLSTRPFNLDSGQDCLKRQFEAGVREGFGLFNLLLSAMPAKLTMLLHLVGFSGEKALGMSESTKSATMEGTLRSPMASMALLCHQMVLTAMIGAEEPNLELCGKLIAPLAKKYPNGAIILFLLARYRLISGKLDEALQLYRRSIRAQAIYRQFHHVCHWELVIGNALLLHWNRAAWHAKKLLDESRWSKCIYAYFLAILVDADRTVEKGKESVRLLMRKVPANRIKIAGKSLPMEKFCERRALKWLEKDEKEGDGSSGQLLLAQFEFLYLWNGFSTLERCPWLIRPILAHIDSEWERWQRAELLAMGKCRQQLAEEKQLAIFLRAICHRTMGQFEKAEAGFEAVLQSESSLQGTSSAYLLPNACLELALTRIGMASQQKVRQHHHIIAMVHPLLTKALSYRGYALETKLHFRVHGAMQRIAKNDGK